MTMRQQPVQARMCGVGEKCKCAVPSGDSFPADRRPVDPTPIIQLKVMDPNGDDIVADESDESELRRPDPGPHGMTYMQSKPGS